MDPIANMLTSIRNALAVQHETVVLPFSNLKYQIALILVKNNFVEKIEKKQKRNNKNIEITLKYLPLEGGLENVKKPAINGLKRISKPGQRIYLDSTKLKKVKAGHGIAIISTSKGIFTDKQAKKQKIGGEVLCEVW